MLKTAFGAVALLTSMISQACAQQWGAGSQTSGAAPAQRVEAAADPRRTPLPAARENARAHVAGDTIITEGHIARLRSTLKLTAAQQPYWAPVEAALTDLARQQARGDRHGVSTTTMQLRRLKTVAMPLIRTLDDNQKREAIGFARNMGFEQLVAAF